MLVWRRVAPLGNLRKNEYEQLLHKWAWELLREILIERYQVDIAETGIHKDKYGKPSLPAATNLYFNLSHCEGMVACIISEREAGIDVEYLRPYCRKVIRKACTLEEQEALDQMRSTRKAACEMQKVQEAEVIQKEQHCTAEDELFFRLWTLKESYIKAIGKGLSFPMKEISFCLKNGKWIAKEPKNADFHQLKIENEFILSWCEKR